MKITADNVTPHGVHPRMVTAEASTLGLRPGEWPDRLPSWIGNGRDLIKFNDYVDEGDLIYVDYLQANGELTLRIYND